MNCNALRVCKTLNLRRFQSLINKYSTSKNQRDEFVVTSKAAPITVPSVLLHHYLIENMRKHDHRTLAECLETQKKLTYGDAIKQSKNFAGFLQKSKLTKGDKVAVLLPNVPEYLVAVLGTMQSGSVVTTMNPAYTPGEIGRQLVNSDSKLIITTVQFCNNVFAALEQFKLQIPIVVIKQNPSDSQPEGTINFHEVCQQSHGDFKEPQLTPDDDVFMLYSSGTTGLPKGVQLKHRNILANLFQATTPEFKLVHESHGDYQDVLPLIVPMYHCYGLCVHATFLLPFGVKFTMTPVFNMQSLYKHLHTYPPSVLYTVPPIVLMLINNKEIQFEKVKSLRTIVSAAAPLGISDIERLLDKTESKLDFFQMYGMTETSPLTHLQSKYWTGGYKHGGCGLAIANTKFKVCDTNDTTYKGLGPNKSGVIMIKGPQVTSGYYKNEKATNETIVDDGWFITGDIGHYDEDEHLFITDRLKDLIKVKGYQVAPAELEEILRSHPDITDAAVVGIKDERAGELPKAFVVAKNGANVCEEDVHKFMVANAAKYKQLKGGVVFVNDIPKTPSGKILRRNLRE